MKVASSLKTLSIAVCVVFVLLGGWIAVRWDAPPLRLRMSASEVVVDVQTLGEYPTTITRVCLSDLSQSRVVWEIVTKHGTPQIHEFSLKPNDNPTMLDAQYGDYRVVVPIGAGHVALRRGVKYRIELWGGKTALTKTWGTFSFTG